MLRRPPEHAPEVEKAVSALPRVYKKIVSNHTPTINKLNRLVRLSGERGLTEPEHHEVSVLLAHLGQGVFHDYMREADKYDSPSLMRGVTLKSRRRTFERDFGHIPGRLEQAEVLKQCVGNSLAQGTILGAAGAAVGAFDMPEHSVATVEIGGRKRVLEYKFLKERGYAPTVEEYIRELAAARDDPAHSMHYLANRVLPAGKPTAERISGRMRHISGERAALSYAHSNWASELILMGKHSKAARQAEMATGLDPGNYHAYVALGSALSQMGKRKAAYTAYSKAVDLMPEVSSSHTEWGFALSRGGDLSEAESHFREAIRLNPKDRRAHMGLGKLLKGRWPQDAEKQEEARELLTKAANLLADKARMERMREEYAKELRSKLGIKEPKAQKKPIRRRD